MMFNMKRILSLFLTTAILLTLTACGSKDELAGTWSAELEYDGVITWTFDGKGKCTMENSYMEQEGTYSIDGDQLTVESTLHLYLLCGGRQPHYGREHRLWYQRHF